MTQDGARDNRRNPSTRFWGLLLVFWIVLGVASVVARRWWLVVMAAIWILAAANYLRRKASEKPR
jgi:hypothetical protein